MNENDSLQYRTGRPRTYPVASFRLLCGIVLSLSLALCRAQTQEGDDATKETEKTVQTTETSDSVAATPTATDGSGQDAGSVKVETFHTLSREQIAAIISEPTAIAQPVASLTQSEVAGILIAAIGVMESMNMPEETVAAKLNIMLNSIADARGEAFGAAVMARIRKKVNPRLLPIVSTAAPPAAAPAPSPKYDRQSE